MYIEGTVNGITIAAFPNRVNIIIPTEVLMFRSVESDSLIRTYVGVKAFVMGQICIILERPLERYA